MNISGGGIEINGKLFSVAECLARLLEQDSFQDFW